MSSIAWLPLLVLVFFSLPTLRGRPWRERVSKARYPSSVNPSTQQSVHYPLPLYTRPLPSIRVLLRTNHIHCPQGSPETVRAYVPLTKSGTWHTTLPSGSDIPPPHQCSSTLLLQLASYATRSKTMNLHLSSTSMPTSSSRSLLQFVQLPRISCVPRRSKVSRIFNASSR